MKDYMLEVCVDSTESALAAVAGGADRLELCADLIIGGTTPSTVLLTQIQDLTKLPIHVLIRPRFGDFCYSQYEYQRMLDEVRLFRALGAQGVVIGILKEDGSLDKDRMKGLIAEARGMKITLHRAFDMCIDPMKTLEDAIELGINLILTSGQQSNCVKGSNLIKRLVQSSKGQIRIMAGSGMNAEAAEQIYRNTGVRDFHLSGKRTKDSRMKYRKKEVSMGLPYMSEYEVWETDAKAIEKMKHVLERV